MKKFLLLSIFFLGLFALSCTYQTTDPPAKAQSSYTLASDVGSSVEIIRAIDETSVPADPAPPVGVVGFIKNNVLELSLALLAFLKVIVNLTPTESDNKVFGLLDNLINWIVPNFKAGGGKFT